MVRGGEGAQAGPVGPVPQQRFAVNDHAGPPQVFALIPAMKNGDDPAIIARWLELAGPEERPDRRADAAYYFVRYDGRARPAK